jgi:hypothetical protein
MGLKYHYHLKKKTSYLTWKKEHGFGTLCDNNDMIRQMRWTGNGYLGFPYYCTGFTPEQTQLLFKALQQSLSKNLVIMV